MAQDEAFLLFDDARPGGRARLYRHPREIVRADRLDEVRQAMDRLRRVLGEGFHVAGTLAYECGAAFEPALRPGAPVGPGPLLWFGVFDQVERPDDVSLHLMPPDGAFALAPVPRIEREAYLQAATAVRERLFAGDLYQANLTFGCDVPVFGHPLALYARLRDEAGAGWGGIANTGDSWLLSFSPEQFFTLADGVVEARPMKGTAPRGRSVEEDRALAAALARDEKQRAENLMIVDLMRNDLARIGEPGSVEVPALFEVERYPTVHQMISVVRARLRRGLDALDILETIFPCGSITGAPKIAAVQALRQLEPEPRGLYTGSYGWIEPSCGDRPGDAAFNVLIRSLEWRDGPIARLGLGSGLVVDSKAGDEWEECRLKGAFVSRRQPRFDLIETMQFDPSEGLVELERHLERLRRSADQLGFRYDRHAARNELQAATFGHRSRAMVRLLLSPSGRMAIEVKPLDEPGQLPVEVIVRTLPVDPTDFRLRHKTTDRHFFDDVRRECDRFEVIFQRADGQLTEGSRSSIFVEKDGRLTTPPLSLGLMPSVFRQVMIDSGRVREGLVTMEDLADGFFIGNSARGLIPARLVSTGEAAAA